MTHFVRHYNVPYTMHSIINLRHHALFLQDSGLWHMKWFETVKCKVVEGKYSARLLWVLDKAPSL